jgi:diphthamide biosynthesis protein 4
MTGTVLVNYYELLSVPPTATTKEIREAYRAILLKNHPDKRYTPVTFDVDLLKTAYANLSSPKHRAAYDASLTQSNKMFSLSHPRPAELVPLENFTLEGDLFKYPCRCGSYFLLELSDVEAEVHELNCAGCSEIIWAEYKLTDE